MYDYDHNRYPLNDGLSRELDASVFRFYRHLELYSRPVLQIGKQYSISIGSFLSFSS